MSDLKTAAILALEALTKNSDRVTEIRMKADAIKALEEALAKQEQGKPVANPEWANNDSRLIVHYLRKYTILDADRVGAMMDFAAECAKRGYTTPQQRKPLTDEQMNALWFDTNKQHGSVIWRFARAIEAAHGIKE